MTKEDVEGCKESTEARNDEPRRGNKNRRAFRETLAVGERREEDLGEGEEEASEGERKRGTGERFARRVGDGDGRRDERKGSKRRK